MRKTWLELVITNLMIARSALRACSAPTNKRQRDPLSRFPLHDLRANGVNNSGKLVSRNMGKANVRIMTHPAVPIASAQPGCLYVDHHTPRRGCRIRQPLDRERLTKRSIDCRFQFSSPIDKRAGHSFAHSMTPNAVLRRPRPRISPASVRLPGASARHRGLPNTAL